VIQLKTSGKFYETLNPCDMKMINLFKKMVVVCLALVIISSCEKDEGFTQVTVFEKGIHDAINAHRVSIGKEKMVLQYLMAKDAKDYSAKLASGVQDFNTNGILEKLDIFKNNLKGDAAAVWITTCMYENADSVLSIALNNAEIKETIEGDFTQSAVGAVEGENGTFYITHLLLRIPKITK